MRISFNCEQKAIRVLNWFFFENFFREKNFVYIDSIYIFLRESFNLWRPLLMIVFYHQTNTPINFLVLMGCIKLIYFWKPKSNVKISKVWPKKKKLIYFFKSHYWWRWTLIQVSLQKNWSIPSFFPPLVPVLLKAPQQIWIYSVKNKFYRILFDCDYKINHFE